LGVSERETGE